MTSPLITILMPLRQYRPDFLRKSLNSVFHQSSPHWKVCIVTEKRDRNHFATVLEAELKDPRISLIPNQGRRLGGALNTGMRQATTDFVGILFGDDMWATDAVTVLGQAISQNPKVDFFHSSRIIIDECDQPISSVHYSNESFVMEDFLHASPIKHLLCWRRQLGLAVGGIDESHNHGPDDYDFPWTMAEAGAQFQAIEEPLYLYRDHRESYRLTTHVPLSSQKWALRKILKKHGIDRVRIRERVAQAEASYLRQCLFKTRKDRQREITLGDQRAGWRDTYT
jgi:glycosyltransferase involved in cell wall biosynthesis